MCLTPLFILLLLAFTAYGQQERVAIIQTMDNNDSIGFNDLAYLTDKLRETAVNVLPKEQYGVMTTESIVAFLGSQERAAKVCKEASCLAELGRKVSADYVAQGRIGRFSKDLTIKVELYNVKTGNLIGSFTGHSKDIYGFLTLIDEKATDLFKKMLNAPSSSSTSPPAVSFVAPQEETAPPIIVSSEAPTVANQEEEKEKEQSKTDGEPYEPTKNSSMLSFGLRAGFNFSHGSFYCSIDEYDNNGNNGNITRIQLGVVLDMATSEMFHFQPGLMYVQRGMKYEGFKDKDDETITAHYIEFPLLLLLKLSTFRFNAGPYIGLCLDSGNCRGYAGFIDIGLSTGLGFDIGMFYIGAIYDYGLTDISRLNSYKFYNRTLGFNVGVNL